MEKIDKLEKKLNQATSTITREGLQEWLEMDCTKALLLQFEIDREELGLNWEMYTGDEYTAAKAQARYIKGIPELIESLNDQDGRVQAPSEA